MVNHLYKRQPPRTEGLRSTAADHPLRPVARWWRCFYRLLAAKKMVMEWMEPHSYVQFPEVATRNGEISWTQLKHESFCRVSKSLLPRDEMGMIHQAHEA